MKRIAIEEHFVTREYIDYLHTRNEHPRRDYIEIDGKKMERDWWERNNYMLMDPSAPNRSLEVGESRLKEMDEAGIDMQVLSFVGPNVGRFAPDAAMAMARKRNNELAQLVEKHPDRYAGFADIAPQNYREAPGELERAVRELGLKGVLVSGHIDNEYLDDRKYWPIFEMAAKLDVPIYLHPDAPLPSMIDPYLAYPGLALALWGYAAEAGLHAMRLICSGVFDAYPNLKIILGHLGESLPFWLWRFDSRWPGGSRPDLRMENPPASFKKNPSQYVRDNFYVTTSGMSWPAVLQFVCTAMGADHVLFATDYPHESAAAAVAAVEAAAISDEDKENVFHRNAERLLKLL